MAGDHPGAGFAGRPGKRPKALGNAGLQNSCFDNKILTGGDYPGAGSAGGSGKLPKYI